MDLKRVVYAVVQDDVPFLFNGNNIDISVLEIKGNCINSFNEVTLKNVKKFRWLAPNIFYAEDKTTIYYVLTGIKTRFNRFLAVSKEIPTVGRGLKCTVLIFSYYFCYESEIVTNTVKKVKKIGDNLYKVRSGHTYYVKVAQGE